MVAIFTMPALLCFKMEGSGSPLDCPVQSLPFYLMLLLGYKSKNLKALDQF